MIKYKIGLEAETFLFNKTNAPEIVPAYYDRDDFPLLAEIRGKPGESVGEVVGNFVTALIELRTKLERNKSELHMDSHSGFYYVPLSLHKEAHKVMGGKAVDESLNIYGTSVEEFPDDQRNLAGRITHRCVSCGLHVHFSAEEVVTKQEPLYTKAGKKEYTRSSEFKTIEIGRLSLLKPRLVISDIVKGMDKELYPKLISEEVKKRCKYRQPGFYELKPYGFEYRSLPYIDQNVDVMTGIVETAFDLLKKAVG